MFVCMMYESQKICMQSIQGVCRVLKYVCKVFSLYVDYQNMYVKNVCKVLKSEKMHNEKEIKTPATRREKFDGKKVATKK